MGVCNFAPIFSGGGNPKWCRFGLRSKGCSRCASVDLSKITDTHWFPEKKREVGVDCSLDEGRDACAGLFGRSHPVSWRPVHEWGIRPDWRAGSSPGRRPKPLQGWILGINQWVSAILLVSSSFMVPGQIGDTPQGLTPKKVRKLPTVIPGECRSRAQRSHRRRKARGRGCRRSVRCQAQRAGICSSERGRVKASKLALPW